MCSWCYAFSPTFEKLKNALPKDIKVQYVMGGLAPHSDEVMPQNMQEMLKGIWKQIEERVGTKFNFDFWTNCTPKRSTYLSCQATIVARNQDKEYEMIKAIQKAYYLEAKNPSDTNTLVSLAEQIGLEKKEFTKALTSISTITKFKNDLNLGINLQVNGFPSLVLQNDDKYKKIQVDYKNHQSMLKEIMN